MPQGRPSIPADTERTVRTRAGHRCSVDGETSALELAHIDDWAKSADHSAQNLLLLCANCHTRSHKEKWDRKTLRYYRDHPFVHRARDFDRRIRNLRYATIGNDFVGREDTLVLIHENLRSGHITALKGHALHGMGGVGKTRAAHEYAFRFAPEYRALLLVDADSPEKLSSSLAALCARLILDLPEQNVTDQNVQEAAVLEWLQSHRDWLLIIDNADSDDALAAVESLLTSLSGGHVLVTTRLTNLSPAFHAIPLEVLSEESSIAYLQQRLTGAIPLPPEDAVHLPALARLLGGLALALEQATAYIRRFHVTVAEYIHRWQSRPAEALAWHDAKKMPYPRSLAVTFDTSFAQLSDGARALLQSLAWFAPDPVPRTLLEEKSAPADAAGGLAELINLSLAKDLEDGHAFTLHRLVQEVVRQQHSDGATASPRGAAVHSEGIVTPSRGAAAVDCGDLSPLSESGLVRASGASPARGRGAEGEEDRAGDSAPPATSRPTPKLEQVPALQSGFAAPAPLLAALTWVNDAFTGDPQDVRSWPRIAPLAPHAAALGLHAADLGISAPSSRLLNDAAVYYDSKAQHSIAEPLYRSALAIDEAALGKDHPEIATRLNNLAQLLQATNRFAEAEPLIRRAVAIDEGAFGENHPNVATCLNNLAQLLKATNRLAEAEPLMRSALNIFEDFLGKDHPNVASSLSNLAQLLQATNRLAEAEPLMRRALAIDEASFGKEHPNVATALNNLAQLLQDTNRLAEAEPLMRQALTIWETAFGLDHPQVASGLHNLAALLKATNHLAEAETLSRRALAIDEAAFGKDHPNVAIRLNNLANLHYDSGRIEEAEPLMRRVVSIFENTYGMNHPDVAKSLSNLAVMLQETNRLDEAEQIIRRSLAINEATFDSNHPSIAVNLFVFATLLLATNRLADAEPPMRRAVGIFAAFNRSTGHEHPHFKAAIGNYVALLMKMGMTEEEALAKVVQVLEIISAKPQPSP